jgi:hypothetical protein
METMPLDYCADKLIHARMLLVPLRERLCEHLTDSDRGMLTQSVEDLAKGVIGYCIRGTEKDGTNTLAESVRGINRARSKQDVYQAFGGIIETEPYWRYVLDYDYDGTGREHFARILKKANGTE